jgi:hypothetical protein
MKLHTVNNTIERSGEFQTSNFKIEATAKAFKILSDGLYSNKIKAVVRELSTNAYDSHVDAGHPEKPFDVFLPTRLEPTFYIRDYGTGLSCEDCMDLYTTYFRSNRTDSNDSVGCLGLGSKSPFAYADQFLVESFFNGTHYTFSSYQGEDGSPVFALLESQETDEPNGLKVSLAVQEDDCYEFEDEATAIYQHFAVRPEINKELNYSDRESLVSGENWTIYNKGYDNDVIMGQVVYPIDIRQFDEESEVYKLLNNCNGFEIVAQIGELDITPSRESLSYNNRTKDNLLAILKKALDELADKISVSISECETLWEARCKYADMDNTLNRVPAARDSLEGIISWNGLTLFDNLHSKKVEVSLKGGEVIYFSKSRWRQSISRDTVGYIMVMPAVDNCHVLFEDVKRGAIGRIRKLLTDKESGTTYLIRGDEKYLKTVIKTLGCKREDITNVSTLEAPPTKSSYGGGGSGEAGARGWIWQKKQCGTGTEWIRREGIMSVKEDAYYICVSRGMIVDELVDLTHDSMIGTWLTMLEKAGRDMSMFNHRILMVTPSKCEAMKLPERDNWMSLTEVLQHEFQGMLVEKRDLFVAQHNSPHCRLCPSEGDGSIKANDVLLIADSTKTENSFKEAAKILRSNTIENEDVKNNIRNITQAAQSFGLWAEFKESFSENKVDYGELYDIMMTDHPMLKLTLEQCYSINLEEGGLKTVSNYVDGIKE